jgi:hypothetical protein
MLAGRYAARSGPSIFWLMAAPLRRPVSPRASAALTPLHPSPDLAGDVHAKRKLTPLLILGEEIAFLG